MAELADAHGSGPCESNFMEVRVLLPAPTTLENLEISMSLGFRGFLFVKNSTPLVYTVFYQKNGSRVR